MLGAVFKVTGAQPLPMLPLKGNYAQWRFRALSALSRHPIQISIAVANRKPGAGARVLLGEYGGPGAGAQLRQGSVQAYFVDDRDISSPEVTAEVAAMLGLRRDEVLAAINDPAVKDRLRHEVDAAIKLGVFGSPYILIDGEPFWGVDRFDQIERWLGTGPF